MFFNRASTRDSGTADPYKFIASKGVTMSDQTETSVCKETGAQIPANKLYVATRDNDKSHYVTISQTAIDKVPDDLRENINQTWAAGGGFEIYPASIGRNGQVNYQVSSDGGEFIFSISADTARRFFPIACQSFPCKEPASSAA